MPHWRQLMDRDYLGHWDLLSEDGKSYREVTVTISEAKGGEIHEATSNTKQRKPVLFFEGKKKGMICNTTNAKTIESMCGTGLVQEWVGKRITLYVTKTSSPNGMVDCIRVRPKEPK